MSNPAVDTKAFGNVARVELLGQFGRQQAAEIGRRAEFVHAMHFDELLIFYFVVIIAIAAAAAVARIAPLFDFDEQHLEREPLVGKYAREVDQLFEDIEECSLFGAAATRNHIAALMFEFHQMLADDDRFDDKHIVLLEKRPDLVAN